MTACLRWRVLGAGLVLPMDILVSDGGLKLLFLLLSAQYLGYQGLWLGRELDHDGAHHLTFWPAILLDCMLYPKAAALMNGPFIKTLTGRHPYCKIQSGEECFLAHLLFLVQSYP